MSDFCIKCHCGARQIATLQFCSSSVELSNVALTMKLIYFDMQGRAEFSRLLLAQAGVQYEDKRISPAEWEKLKPSKLLR